LAVLIDFPDFNLRLARRLQQRQIPVVYFVSPQVWAWRKRRVAQLRECVARMLVIFDFEAQIYQRAGVPVEYVGHPLVDLAKPRVGRAEFFAQAGLNPSVPTVALLPGSRMKEVLAHLPVMLECAQRLASPAPVQFVVTVAPTISVQWIEEGFLARYWGKAVIRPVVHSAYDVLAHSQVAVVASGTATLEAALLERPMIVVYHVSALTWLAGKLLVRVPYYSMVNILAKRELAPELMQKDFNAENLATKVQYLMEHPAAREEMVRGFQEVKRRLGAGGAIQRAADAVVRLLGARGRVLGSGS